MEKGVGILVNLMSFFALNKAVYWVHKFFATPRNGKLNKQHLPLFLQKATPSFFIYKNEKVYTYQWNSQALDKPLLLLIHGWESNSARWEALQTYLGSDFRYVAFDAPSLGQSYGRNLSVKNYQEVIDLAIEKFQPQGVIGHSLGAFTLFQQLSEQIYPSVEKVVIMGVFDRFEIILSHYFKLLGYNKRLIKAYRYHIEQWIGKPLAVYCSSKALETVDIPVLCIHDIQDPQVFYQETVHFHQALQAKNNRVVSTTGLGHSLQDEGVFETIQAFFK